MLQIVKLLKVLQSLFPTHSFPTKLQLLSWLVMCAFVVCMFGGGRGGINSRDEYKSRGKPSAWGLFKGFQTVFTVKLEQTTRKLRAFRQTYATWVRTQHLPPTSFYSRTSRTLLWFYTLSNNVLEISYANSINSGACCQLRRYVFNIYSKLSLRWTLCRTKI